MFTSSDGFDLRLLDFRESPIGKGTGWEGVVFRKRLGSRGPLVPGDRRRSRGHPSSTLL